MSFFPCPECGGDKTAVRNTRYRIDGSAMRRRRICPCGYRFTTYEMQIDFEDDEERYAITGDQLLERLRAGVR